MVLRLAASSASGQQLESYLTDFFGQREPTQELLSRHPELPDKVTAQQAQQSVDAMLAVPLSVKTLRPLVRSCPRLLWRGQDFADAVKGDNDAADSQVKSAGSVSPMLAQELHELGGTTEPDYPGYWAMDYNPVHSSVTGMPCRWVKWVGFDCQLQEVPLCSGRERAGAGGMAQWSCRACYRTSRLPCPEG